MSIKYLNPIDELRPAEFAPGFFAGWRRTPRAETHIRLLRGSTAAVVAFDTEARLIVGFATALSDGVLAAYVSFVEVVPAYRNQGIGSELVRRILKAVGPIYALDLTCDAETQPFYQRLGMFRSVGMLLRDYEVQAGKAVSLR